jgi:hypothetical protein
MRTIPYATAAIRPQHPHRLCRLDVLGDSLRHPSRSLRGDSGLMADRGGRLDSISGVARPSGCTTMTGPQYTPSPTICRWKSRWQHDIASLGYSTEKHWLTISIAERRVPGHLLLHAPGSQSGCSVSVRNALRQPDGAADRLPIRTVRLGNVGCQVSANHADVVANTTPVGRFRLVARDARNARPITRVNQFAG